MVDSSVRRCSFNLYKTACAIPPTAPDCKVAMIKKQYSQPADEAKMIPNPSTGWLNVKAEWLQQLEVMLRYLKLEGVRSALAASVPATTEKKAAEHQLRFELTELNLMVVAAFENTTMRSGPRHLINVNRIRDALVAAVRAVFVKYEVVNKVPPPPAGARVVKVRSHRTSGDIESESESKGQAAERESR